MALQAGDTEPSARGRDETIPHCVETVGRLSLTTQRVQRSLRSIEHMISKHLAIAAAAFLLSGAGAGQTFAQQAAQPAGQTAQPANPAAGTAAPAANPAGAADQNAAGVTPNAATGAAPNAAA